MTIPNADVIIAAMTEKIGHCRDCRHWLYEMEYQLPKVDGIRVCKRAKLLWDSVTWRKADDDSDTAVGTMTFRDGVKDEKAFVQDGSDYLAFLVTKADFGCVQFEQNT